MGIKATVRLDKRTKNLAKRIKRGEIAVIDHEDIDGASADMLVDRQVAAVINVSNSISGRYPNVGPQILVKAGIPLIDAPDIDLFKYLKEGEEVELDKAVLRRNGTILVEGDLLTVDKVKERMESAKLNLNNELESFAENTLSYVVKEKGILLDPTNFPLIDTPINGRQTLIVVRGESYKEDLAIIRTYLRDVKPVLIGVDGGADALIDLGFRPDIIIGDMDSVSDRALKCGAEILVHAYTDAARISPGQQRVHDLGIEAKTIAVPGTSEDIAMLLAYENGAELIVAVGTHSHLIDFLDKGRKGMSSTFLVRLKVGSRLVDAKGVSRLYGRKAPAIRDLCLISLAAVLVFLSMVVFSPSTADRLRTVFTDIANSIRLLLLGFRVGLKL
ncbi:MAG: putative cytokinetic ring protein SteA [Armatimonadota bacterium]|nr:putative cytokinetic ring protein SteA [Armatimonadota bacterium]